MVPANLQPEALSEQEGASKGPPQTIEDPRIIRGIQQYREALERGDRPDRDQILKQYPEVAEELAGCLDTLDFVHQVVPQFCDQAEGAKGGTPKSDYIRPLATVGDFRIVREIGRGGMGIVYEATQLSLNRRVALKVLPFVAVLDPKQLQRFKNEAQAAAALDHPNVVEVYSVGCERGVHYYAMHYIEGQTLASVIHELRQLSGLVPEDEQQQASAVSRQTRDLVSGRLTPPASKLDCGSPTVDRPSGIPQSASPPSEMESPLPAGISTDGSTRNPEFFRSVAKLGIQAAEALEHAHEMGVVHRDIKPSNLMVDDRGHLWITDFGLAMTQIDANLTMTQIDANLTMTQTDANLTMTGDLLGTLRYMSPEQVQAKHGVLDHRSDVYSLGVTLYELLTLQPAFPGDDRQKLLRQVAEDDPWPPRQVNKAIPRDLETIVLKATAKEPEDRYATAQELTNDLGQFLEEKPIRARRPSLVQRAAKWSRRHRPVVCSATVLLAIATMVAAARAWDQQERRVELEADVGRELAAAEAFLLSGNYPAASQSLGEARGHLAQAQCRTGPLATSLTELSQQVSAKTLAEQQFNRFQELRQRVHSKMYAVDPRIRERTLEDCRATLELYRVCKGGNWQKQPAFENLGPQRQAALKEHVAEMLFVLACVEFRNAKYGDRDAAHRRAVDALRRIETLHPPIPAVYLWIADCWRALNENELADQALKQAEKLRPRMALDYYILAEHLKRRKRNEDALVSYRMALCQQPGHFLSLLACGLMNTELLRLETADAMLSGAIAVNPRATMAIVQRASCSIMRGKPDLAEPDLARALKLSPEDYQCWLKLGDLQRQKGNLSQALATYTKTLKVNPSSYYTHLVRGRVYAILGEHQKAEADFSCVIRMVGRRMTGGHSPYLVAAYLCRALARARLGQTEAALDDLHAGLKAAESQPETKSIAAWFLATCPDSRLRDADRAVELASDTVKLSPKQGSYWDTLGVAQYRAGNWRAAVEALQKSGELECDRAGATWFFRAMAHWQLGEKEEARRWYDKAVKWTDQNKPEDEQLRRFRAEAAELLGIKEQ